MRAIVLVAAALCIAAHAQTDQGPVVIEPPPKYEEPPVPPFKMTPKEVAEYAKGARAALANQLKDPSTAQFRGLFLSQGRMIVDGNVQFPIQLCGEVNAKNSYGGYVGFKRFAATLGGGVIEDDSAFFGEVIWDRQCSKKLRDLK
jgi:hypothetical protein